MNRSQGRWFFVIAGVLIVAGLALGLWRRDIQVEPPEVFGRVWTTAEAAPAWFLYVTREERSRAVRGVGRTASFRWNSYDRYALHVRRIADGALLHTLALGDYKERNEAVAPQIIGVVGEVVWLWREGPEARALPALDLRCDAMRLQQESPRAAAFLPQDPKGFAVRSEPRSLIMRGRDAQLYTIDAGAATLMPLAPEDLPANTFSTRVEDRFDHLIPPGRSQVVTHPYNLLEIRFLTRTGQWYALLSDSEYSALENHAPSGRPHGDVARRFYRGDYEMNGNRPELIPATVGPVGDARLLQAGFIVRGPATLWDVPEPSSTLVLAKPLLGDTEPWEVVRLARDGTMPWRTSTGLADPGGMLDLGDHVLFIGQRVRHGSGATATRDTRERIVWIDTRTGARRTLVVATGELDPPVDQ